MENLGNQHLLFQTLHVYLFKNNCVVYHLLFLKSLWDNAAQGGQMTNKCWGGSLIADLRERETPLQISFNMGKLILNLSIGKRITLDEYQIQNKKKSIITLKDDFAEGGNTCWNTANACIMTTYLHIPAYFCRAEKKVECLPRSTSPEQENVSHWIVLWEKKTK